jgi:hypothetical protein
LQAGTKELGFPPTLSSVVPDPEIGLVHHQFRVANASLEEEMEKQVNGQQAQPIFSNIQINCMFLVQWLVENRYLLLVKSNDWRIMPVSSQWGWGEIVAHWL